MHGQKTTFLVEDERSIRAVLEQSRMISKCVVCFSNSGDQLSQWRAYGTRAPAIAIGFDPIVLAETAKSLDHGWKLDPCLYLATDKELAVAPLVEAIVQEWPAPQAEGSARREAIHKAVAKVWNEYLHIAPRLKHEGLREEAEVRLVSMPIVDDALWHFRRGPNLVLPYVEFPLTNAGTPWTSIREILIGPNPHHKALESAVQHLCTVRGINLIVRTSAIPYR